MIGPGNPNNVITSDRSSEPLARLNCFVPPVIVKVHCVKVGPFRLYRLLESSW
jgi:hypothetical protein